MAENSHSTTSKVLWGWFALLLLLGFCIERGNVNIGGRGEDEEISWHELTPCSAENTVFATMPFQEWAGYYHTTVGTVINAQIAAQQQRSNETTLRCTSDEFADLLPPTPELETLARTLPPWKPRSMTDIIFGTATQPDVSASDMTPVLMEFLRIYECSLLERQYEGILDFRTSSSSSAQESSSEWSDEEPASSAPPYPSFEDQLIIAEELASARPALERTIVLLSGMDRLQPLVAELSCLERSLADIRNITGLLAEESSCWNRSWDARGSLRDLSSE